MALRKFVDKAKRLLRKEKNLLKRLREDLEELHKKAQEAHSSKDIEHLKKGFWRKVLKEERYINRLETKVHIVMNKLIRLGKKEGNKELENKTEELRICIDGIESIIGPTKKRRWWPFG